MPTRKPRRSWKTTACGAAAIVATAVIGADFSPIITKIAACVGSAAAGLGLMFSRDNNVSSQDVADAAKKDAPQP